MRSLGNTGENRRFRNSLSPNAGADSQPRKNRINLSATIAHLPAITHTSHSSSFSGILDLASAIKASQALSSQMELSELLSSLMQDDFNVIFFQGIFPEQFF